MIYRKNSLDRFYQSSPTQENKLSRNDGYQYFCNDAQKHHNSIDSYFDNKNFTVSLEDQKFTSTNQNKNSSATNRSIHLPKINFKQDPYSLKSTSKFHIKLMNLYRQLE